MAKGYFRSLRVYNYRVWAIGAVASNVGTWMQRTAQDWIVLTQLTDHSATAVGIVLGLQWGPQLLLLPWAGIPADRFDRRKVLIVTQCLLGLLALVLGLLCLTGWIQLWHVYLMAFLSGCVTAVDGPTSQTIVVDLVTEEDLSNAVALNSTSFNMARMVGPAVAGLLIAAVGSGWAFVINGLSYGATLTALYKLRRQGMHSTPRARRGTGGIMEGLRYVSARPDLKVIMLMLVLIGTFGLNFPIFISAMSVKVFNGDANQYGLLTSAMAVGTMSGAFLAAGRERARFRHIVTGVAVFSFGFMLAAFMPNVWLFGASLVVIGVSALTFTNSTQSFMLMTVDPAMRGRVMALRMAVIAGATPIGAPLAGWVADRFGARASLGLGALAGFLALAVALRYWRKLRIQPSVPAAR